MTKMSLMAAIDEILDDEDQNFLRELLEEKADTIYHLATLKNKMRKNPSPVGICSKIWNACLVAALSPSWKHFSGNATYPVPGNTKNLDPELAYCNCHPAEAKWFGQQKRYRFSLIDHLLKNAPAFYKAVEERLK